jgi:hypothetical protein
VICCFVLFSAWVHAPLIPGVVDVAIIVLYHSIHYTTTKKPTRETFLLFEWTTWTILRQRGYGKVRGNTMPVMLCKSQRQEDTCTAAVKSVFT